MIKRFFSFLLVFSLMLLIAEIYTGFVVEYYNYWFYKNEIPINSLFLYYLVPPFLAFFMSQEIKKPSDFLAWIYFFLVILPTISLAPYLSIDFYVGSITNFLVFFVGVFFILIGKVDENKLIPYVKGIRLNYLFIFIILLTFIFIFILSLNYKFNISKVLDLSIFTDTYLIRDEFRESKSESSGIAGYVIFWLAKVFLPFFICYGLCFKNKIALFSGFLLQIIVFSVSAHKSFFFSIILIFVIYFLLKFKSSFYQWLLGLFSLTFSSFILYKIFNFNFLVDVIIRRSLIVPGVLSNWWINYFSINEYVYFKNSFLGNFFESNYDVAGPFLIGKYYFGSDWTSANVNFAVDSFGNGGIIPVFIFLLILGFILLFFNRYSQGSDKKTQFIILLTVPTFWSFIETSFISVLVTHGLFWVILIVLLFRKK